MVNENEGQKVGVLKDFSGWVHVTSFYIMTINLM